MKRNETYLVFLLPLKRRCHRDPREVFKKLPQCLPSMFAWLYWFFPLTFWCGSVPAKSSIVYSTNTYYATVIISILCYLIMQIHTGDKYLEWSNICAWYVFSGRLTYVVHGRPRLRWPLFAIEFSYICIIKKYHFL